ncbi:hypothetical protein [Nostoc sp.]|uniref:hypothetical protein n=1 Tax=Nostoc sp. TaxID=1180 RepID=UPI003594174D
MTQTQESPHAVEEELYQDEGSREQEEKSSCSPASLDKKNFAAMNGVNVEIETSAKPQSEVPEPEEIVTTCTVSQNPILKMGVIGGGIFVFIMLIGGVINGSMNVLNMGSTKIEPSKTNQEKIESSEIVDETGQTKTALALTSQNSEFKKIRDQKAASSPTPTSSFTPVSVAPPPTPRTVQRTQPISVSRNPAPPRINYPPTRSSPVVYPQPKPVARVTPAMFNPVKTQSVDPMQEWLAAANVGSFSTNSTESTTNSSVLTDGVEGGTGTPKSLPLNKELSKNPTINSQNTDDNALRILVGTRTEGKLETPIALNASNGQQGIQKFLIRLTKPLKASDGSEVLPVDSYLVVVPHNNTSEYIQMSAIAALININGHTLEKPLTENSILILNKNGEKLRAQSRQGSSLGSDFITAVIAGVSKAAEIENSPSSQSTITSNGYSTSTVSNDNKNLLAGFTQGSFNQILQRVQSSNSQQLQGIESAQKVFVVNAGTKVQVFVNQTIFL